MFAMNNYTKNGLNALTWQMWAFWGYSTSRRAIAWKGAAITSHDGVQGKTTITWCCSWGARGRPMYPRGASRGEGLTWGQTVLSVSPWNFFEKFWRRSVAHRWHWHGWMGVNSRPICLGCYVNFPRRGATVPVLPQHWQLKTLCCGRWCYS